MRGDVQWSHHSVRRNKQTNNNLNSLLPTSNSGARSLLTLQFQITSLCGFHRTMNGLYSQSFAGLRPRQPCLFHSKPGHPHLQGRTVAFSIHILGPFFGHFIPEELEEEIKTTNGQQLYSEQCGQYRYGLGSLTLARLQPLGPHWQ